jgi:cyclohexa-1,5-dienecarbonyl-CoA hydratase
VSEAFVRVRRDEGIARVVLDHPPVNVLTRAVLAELRGALRGLAEERELRVLALSARGTHFSAGADVAEHLPPAFRDLIPEFVETVRAVAEFPLPVVAAVQGRCLGGGCELAAAADILIAAEGASFGQPEITLAVFPPAACVMLPGRSSWGFASELLFSGDPVSAREARDAGLVRRVVPDGDLDAALEETLRRIARHSAMALRLTKRCLREGQAGQREALDRAARTYVEELMATQDAGTGLAAFLEKRTPVWRHQ